MKSFEKKPIKGGTPAMEKIMSVIIVRWKLLKLKPWNDCSVLKFVKIELNKVHKRINSEKL
jgi:hypothetical protein